jgi:hypothetical protein
VTLAYLADTTTAGASMSGGLAVTSADVGGYGLPLSISTDDLFFWTRTWREGEAESAAARAAGQVHEFANGTEAVRWLLSDG